VHHIQKGPKRKLGAFFAFSRSKLLFLPTTLIRIKPGAAVSRPKNAIFSILVTLKQVFISTYKLVKPF